MPGFDELGKVAKEAFEEVSKRTTKSAGNIGEDAIKKELRRITEYWPDGIPEGRVSGSDRWLQKLYKEMDNPFDSPGRMAQAYNSDAAKARKLISKLNKIRKAGGLGEWDGSI
jgi:hypothetical protein